jgi:hypothetical protein
MSGAFKSDPVARGREERWGVSVGAFAWRREKEERGGRRGRVRVEAEEGGEGAWHGGR